MDETRLLEKINKACNILDSLRAEIINGSKPARKGKKNKKTVSEEITKPLEEMGELNRELTVKQCLERYGQPTDDDDHIQSVCNIVVKNGITLDQLEGALIRIKEQADHDKVKDIKTYTYGTLHRINRAE